MKNKVARTAITVLFAAVLIVSMSAFAQPKEQHECSPARSAGKWSFTDNGTVIGVGPRTAVGVLTLDGKGNLLNGVATSSLNGTIADEIFSGTYTVNPDCTGTVSAQIFASGTEILALTMNISFDRGMTELRGVFTSVTARSGTVLPTVINLEARKQ